MQNEVPLGQGAMAAVIATDAEVIAKVCEETPGNVQIANYNCPGQIVISGETEALDKLPQIPYNTRADGVWRSLVSRLVRDQEAMGSNPVTPTI